MRRREPAVQVAGNTLTFCARTVDQAVRCWGNNAVGNLGLGSTGHLGNSPGELPATATPVGLDVLHLASGNGNSCVLSAAGVVRCWGLNTWGQLGYGDIANRGDQPGELPTPDVDVGGPVVQLAVGAGSSCALLVDGAVRCWGRNDVGQLGYGDTTNRGDDPGEMPTANLDLGGPATRLGLYKNHVCALMADRKVRCWGNNSVGQLGIGSTATIGDQPGEMPPDAADLGADTLALFVGYSYNCALLVGGGVRCWGYNDNGQLGIGSVDHLGDDEAVSSGPLVEFE